LKLYLTTYAAKPWIKLVQGREVKFKLHIGRFDSIEADRTNDTQSPYASALKSYIES
jgi:hypothetical protein